MNGITISIKTEFADVQRQLNALPDKLRDRVLARSINASMTQGRTEMARRISSEFRVKVSDVKERLTISRATTRDSGAVISASLAARNRAKGRSMNLIHFVEQVVTVAAARKRMKAGEGGTQTLRSGGKVRKALQVRFQIKRAGGQKMIKGAFIGNKGRTVFIRAGKERFPINELNTIDVPNMFNTQRINEVVVAVMRERFTANAQRELLAALAGFLK